jgi:hypothetical protein
LIGKVFHGGSTDFKMTINVVVTLLAAQPGIALREVVEVVGDDRLSATYLLLYPARLPGRQAISG